MFRNWYFHLFLVHELSLSMQVYVDPHVPTATFRTRSCMILVMWETDRWGAGLENQPCLKKFVLTSSCSSFSGLM